MEKRHFFGVSASRGIGALFECGHQRCPGESYRIRRPVLWYRCETGIGTGPQKEVL